MKFGKAIPYDILITATDNLGFNVKVGCCNVVFTDKDEVLSALGYYFGNPKVMEKEYNKAVGSPDAEERTVPTSDSRHEGERPLTQAIFDAATRKKEYDNQNYEEENDE